MKRLDHEVAAAKGGTALEFRAFRGGRSTRCHGGGIGHAGGVPTAVTKKKFCAHAKVAG